MTLSYQGVLTGVGNAPVADGSYAVEFRLYPSDTGSAPIWVEHHPAVAVTEGTFAVILGSISSLASVDFNQTLSLGVAVDGGTEFAPRSRLTSAPSSLAPWKVSGNNLVYLDGNVGIGVTPQYPLHLLGDAGIEGRLYKGGELLMHTPGSVGNFFAGREAGKSWSSGLGFNTGIGNLALFWGTNGSHNTGVGANTLQLTTTGGHNTAVGSSALYNNLSTSHNTAVGFRALYSTTLSEYNTAVGYAAGWSYNNGYNNVFIGANVDVNQNGLFNVIAIGQATTVTASSTARFGNAATGSYGGWAGWTNVSDARFKRNVRDDVPGLEFIRKLRPVTYNFDATGMDAFLRGTSSDGPVGEVNLPHQRALQEKESVTYTGFVAQEVEAAARELGFDFSGVEAPRNDRDYYGLRYAEFVVPLVKAVQEQQKLIEYLTRELDRVKKTVHIE